MENYLHTRKQSTPIKLVLSFVLLYIIAAEGFRFESISQHDKFPSSSLIKVDEKIKLVSPGLVYGSCKRNPLKTTCLLAMETNSNVGSPKHFRYCSFTYDTYAKDKYGQTVGLLTNIVAVDEDKAALSIKYLEFTNLSILHFSDCRVVTVDVGEKQHVWAQTPFDGIFDAVSSNHDTGETFRTVLDFEGNVIVGKRHDWLRKSVDPDFVFRSPLKGRLVIDNGITKLKLFAVNDDGLSELLKEYPVNSTYLYDKYAISPTHQLLSMCTENNSAVVCGQFDLNGVLKFETNPMHLNEASNLFVFKVHNLPGGGLLLLLFKCSNIPPHKCTTDKNTDDYFTVIKFDGTGRKVGSLKITQFPDIYPSIVHRFHFFENEKNEMCLSAVNYYDEENHPLTLGIACFKDEDLSS